MEGTLLRFDAARRRRELPRRVTRALAGRMAPVHPVAGQSLRLDGAAVPHAVPDDAAGLDADEGRLPARGVRRGRHGRDRAGRSTDRSHRSATGDVLEPGRERAAAVRARDLERAGRPVLDGVRTGVVRGVVPTCERRRDRRGEHPRDPTPRLRPAPPRDQPGLDDRARDRRLPRGVRIRLAVRRRRRDLPGSRGVPVVQGSGARRTTGRGERGQYRSRAVPVARPGVRPRARADVRSGAHVLPGPEHVPRSSWRRSRPSRSP